MSEPLNKKVALICGAIILAAILVSAAILGTSYYKKEKIAQQERETALKSQQEQEKLLLQEQLKQQALDAKSQSAALDELKQQVVDLENRPAEIRTETIKENNIPAIIAEWEDRVARVTCNWTYSNDKVYKTNQASGVLVNFTDIGTSLITNKHAVFDGDYTARWCVIGVYGKGSRIVERSANKNPFLLSTNQDWAYIKLGNEYNLPSNPKNTDYGYFDEITSKYLNICKNGASRGDEIVLLGYPGVGTQGGITATRGIISGIEGDYYVTETKFDQGSSGGAVILVQDNCYLGIPTWASTGNIESFGRILKSSFAFGE